jgi:hypothetical protein
MKVVRSKFKNQLDERQEVSFSHPDIVNFMAKKYW